MLKREDPADPLEDDLAPPPSEVPDQYRDGLAQILDQYSDIFGSVLYQSAPVRDNMPEVIPIIPGSKPSNRPLYRYSPLEVQEIEKQVKAMLEQNLIEHSTSPYGAPVLLVKKPDKTWRFCVDYRALNAITIKNSHALPRIDDFLDSIQGAKFFSSMDLLQGFYQLPLQESDKAKTAFKTNFGHFQFRVVSMGLSNAPSVFQRIMNDIFKEYLNKFVVIYLDDILIFSKTAEEHLTHIRKVLETIRKNKLSLKTSKCHFFKSQLKFLGHIISKDGIQPDFEKVTAVKNWPTPTTQSDIRSFLGLVQYFRRFIKGFASIASPLTDLTKDEYKRNFPKPLPEDAQQAFETLKTMLTEAPLLQVPNFEKPFTMITDASQVGLGGVLIQDDKPIAFESKKFSSTECNYQTTERELLGTVYCLKKWAVYLRHNPENVIMTDHIPNVYFNTKPNLSPKEVRWMDTINQFPGKIVYKPGKSNIADPLSRMPSFYMMALLRDEHPSSALL